MALKYVHEEEYCPIYGWMLDLGLETYQIVIFAMIYVFTKSKGMFFYRREWLSEWTNRSVDEVDMAVGWLIYRGLVTRQEIITDYGKIDIIWLNEKTTNVTDLPNKPYLYTSEKLTPVTWTYYEEGITENGQTVNWIEDDAQTTISKVVNQEWYNYTSGSGTDDYIESKWANAKNIDGSYFVWIPRYAYRITYYDKDWTSDNTAKVTGYYDGYGMWKQENYIKI